MSHRHEWLKMCAYNVLSQKFDGRIAWIVVEDTRDLTTDTDRCDYVVESFNEITKEHNFKKTGIYQYVDRRITLGEKRNMLLDLANRVKADFIVWFDDDDVQSRNRVKDTVEKIIKNPQFEIAGVFEILVFFVDTALIFQYEKSTYPGIGTVGHRNGLNLKFHELDTTNEEKYYFLDYRVPIYELDQKTICVINHAMNTVQKSPLNCTMWLPQNINSDPYVIEQLSKLIKYDPTKLRFEETLIGQHLKMFQGEMKKESNVYKKFGPDALNLLLKGPH